MAGDLAGALGRYLGHDVELTVAGRTDTGVHARGQVVTFDAEAPELDLDALVRSVNHQCGPAIAAREAEVVPPDFDARFSARARRYRYLVLNRPHPDPFLAATSWHVERPLDRWAMDLACDPFIGEHDFAALLPPAEAPRRVGGLARAAGQGRVVDRRRRRPAALRDRGRARSATRWCAASSARWSPSATGGCRPATSPGSSGPATAPRPATSPRPTASPSGRSLRRLGLVTLTWASGDQVDRVAGGAEAVDRDEAVVGVAGLEGEQQLHLVDADRHADAVVLDVEHVEAELGQQRGDRWRARPGGRRR